MVRSNAHSIADSAAEMQEASGGSRLMSMLRRFGLAPTTQHLVPQGQTPAQGAAAPGEAPAPGFMPQLGHNALLQLQRNQANQHPAQNVLTHAPDVQPSTALLKHAVTLAMGELPADRRHLLLDRLHGDPAFACLFAYMPGPGAAASCQAAASARITPQAAEALAAAKAWAADQPLPPAAVLAAGTTQAAGPGTVPVATDNPPALTSSFVAEFETYPDISTAGSPMTGPKPSVRLVVSLKAKSEVTKQGNVALTSVLDKSGSMCGSRIHLLKETNHFLVQQVTDQDYLGFVSYSDAAHTDLPLTRMTANAKMFAHTVVESLIADGCTALYDGTVQGLRQQLEALPDDAHLAKALFLCTDGEANVGPKDSDEMLPLLHAEVQRSGRPCTIHTFGIGDGHSAQLLQSLSEMMSGSYYYIRGTADIAPAYGETLGGLFSVVAKNVRVVIRPVGVAAPIINAGGVVSSNTVVFNDIYAEESRDILVTLPLPVLPTVAEADTTSADTAASTATEQKLADVCVTYTDPVLGREVEVVVPLSIKRASDTAAGAACDPHPLVITTATRYQASEVIQRAQRMYQDGAQDEALRALADFQEQAKTAARSMPAAAAQLEMFSAQTQVVRESLQQASRSRDAAMSKKASALSGSAASNLRSQRAATVGVSEALPAARAMQTQYQRHTSVQASASMMSAPPPRMQQP